MNETNTALDNLRISLTQWSYIHPMFQLTEEAKQIISTIKNDNVENTESFTKDRGKNNDKSNYTSNNLNKQTNDNLPSGFKSMKSGMPKLGRLLEHIPSKTIQIQKNEKKFVGNFTNNCYLCRLDNHIHKDCTYLNTWKRLGLKAFKLEQSNTVITPKSNTHDTVAKSVTQEFNLPIASLNNNDSVDINITNNELHEYFILDNNKCSFIKCNKYIYTSTCKYTIRDYTCHPTINITVTNNTTNSNAINQNSYSTIDELPKYSDNLPYEFCYYVNSTSYKLLQTKLPLSANLMVFDSGTSRHMSGILSLFIIISYFNDNSPRHVILGDGTTTLPILGFGSIDITINNYRIILDNVLYIPKLNDTLFSIKEHV